MPESTGISLAEFRERQVRDAVLPKCQLAVQMRANVELLDLVYEGLIPQTLLDIALAARETPDQKEDDRTRARRNFEKLADMRPALDAVFKAVIINPPVADEPDDEHLGILEVPFDDKVWVFQEVNAGAAQLALFRQKPDEPAAPGPGGDSV